MHCQSFINLITAIKVCIILAATAGAAAGQPPAAAARSVPGEFIIKLKETINVESLQVGAEFGDNTGARVVTKLENINALHCKWAEGNEAAAASVDELRRNPNVEYIEPNYLWHAVETLPDDEHIDQMWYLKKIGAPAAWDVQKDSPNVIVAVIDSGVHLGHDDLKSRIWTNPDETANSTDDDDNDLADDLHGWDFFQGDNRPDAELAPIDTLPPLCIPHSTKKKFEVHGTHVAGTIGAEGNNNVGVCGVSWNVKIMPLKFLGGTCGSGSTAGAIAAIDYAVKKGARVINASWGGAPFSQALKDAIDNANDKGVLFCAAAGNSAEDNDASPHFPSSYGSPNIIAVAATDENDKLAGFSCFGLNSVDLAAPGVKIFNAVPSGDENSTTPASKYANLQGTSMATPIVSGAAALIMARFPDLTHREVKQLLLSTVDPVTALSGKCVTGGRLNLQRALNPPLPQHVEDALAAAPAEVQNQLKDPAVRAQLFLHPPGLPLEEQGETSANDNPQDVNTKAFIVRLDPNTTPDAIAKAFTEKYSGEDNQEVGKIDVGQVLSAERNTVVIEVQSPLSETKVAELLEDVEGVQYAEPNFTQRQD
jgi:subtilisin family serine protease